MKCAELAIFKQLLHVYNCAKSFNAAFVFKQLLHVCCNNAALCSCLLSVERRGTKYSYCGGCSKTICALYNVEWIGVGSAIYLHPSYHCKKQL